MSVYEVISMNMFFKVSFFIVYGSFFFLRQHYTNNRKREDTPAESFEVLQEAVKNEGKLSIVFRTILSFGLILCLILYLFNPKSLVKLRLQIPDGLRLLGLLGALSSLPLLYHIHQELGKYWSPDLVLQEDHQLVTTGVYRWVRHPMYSALSVFMVGISLLSAHLVIILPHFLTLLSILSRIDKEEKMMENSFGAEYLQYEKRTGRLIPKFSMNLLNN